MTMNSEISQELNAFATPKKGQSCEKAGSSGGTHHFRRLHGILFGESAWASGWISGHVAKIFNLLSTNTIISSVTRCLFGKTPRLPAEFPDLRLKFSTFRRQTPSFPARHGTCSAKTPWLPAEFVDIRLKLSTFCLQTRRFPVRKCTGLLKNMLSER
jgi:hypothetical protein